nr:hypothetical protein [Candidatus Njordarchaeota archaeon]
MRSTIFESKSIAIEEQVLDLPTLKDSIETLIKTEIVNTRLGDVKFGGLRAKPLSLKFDERAGYLMDWGELFNSVGLVGYSDVEEKDLYDPEEIKAELLSGSEPYEGLSDLILEKTDERDKSGFRPASILIRAPRYLRLNGCLRGDELVASLVTHRKMDLSKLRLSLITRGETDYPAPKRITLPLVNPKPYKGELVEITHKLPVNKETKYGYLYLLQQKQDRFSPVDYKSLYREAKTTRTIVHQHLDPNFETLENWVRGEGKDTSVDFEWGVSLLLSLLGFCTEWVGHTFEKLVGKEGKRSFEVDVIASTPDERTIILGQCTTTSPPETKSRQLKVTASELTRKLGGDAPHIVPVVFTNLDKNDMKEPIKKLKEEGVEVVGKQGLESLLNHMRRGTSLQNVMNTILKLPRIY